MPIVGLIAGSLDCLFWLQLWIRFSDTHLLLVIIVYIVGHRTKRQFLGALSECQGVNRLIAADNSNKNKNKHILIQTWKTYKFELKPKRNPNSNWERDYWYHFVRGAAVVNELWKKVWEKGWCNSLNRNIKRNVKSVTKKAIKWRNGNIIHSIYYY